MTDFTPNKSTSLYTIFTTVLLGLSLTANAEFRPDCDLRASFVKYENLPKSVQTKVQKVRELGSQQSIFNPDTYRRECGTEMAAIESVFKKLVYSSHLEKYVSAKQSLYPIVNCKRNDVDAFTFMGFLSITGGAVRSAADEDELAAAVGHEIGHHLLGHDLSETQNQKSRELAADRVGLSLMIAAGYHPKAFISLLDKFDPKGNADHGTPAERIQNLLICIP